MCVCVALMSHNMLSPGAIASSEKRDSLQVPLHWPYVDIDTMEHMRTFGSRL